MSTRRKGASTRPRSLDQLAHEIDLLALSAREYHQSSDCSEAGYAQTFGYGESKDVVEEMLAGFDDELRAQVEAMREADPEAFYENLAGVCDLTLEGYRVIAHELFSIELGEVEEQLDGDVRDQVMALSKVQREKLRKLLNEAYLGDNDCIYLNMSGERWVMSIDEGALFDWLERRAIVPKAKSETPNVLLSETPEVRRAAFRLIMGGAA
jgi:hypothetical protein